MSVQSSNLSTTGYDLVSAVTQNALNTAMRGYLNQLGQSGLPAITAYYRFNDPIGHKTGVSLMTPDEVAEMTGGVNVFSIPDGTTTDSDPTIKAWADAGFAFALSATIGLPLGVLPSDLPDILALNQAEPQKVTYNSYYRTFNIMELTYGWGSAEVTQISQATYNPAVNPWVFQWEVNLNLSVTAPTAFNTLPADVQQRLTGMSMNPDTMFSMQTLYLDLNSPRLTQGATPSLFTVFPDTDPVYTVLNEFIGNYWTILRNEFGGSLVMNSSLKPQEPSDYPPSSVIPTAANFVISPYSGGTAGLNTLNYLIMSDDRAMPSPIVPFAWDWVTPSTVENVATAEGAMSVRRDLFIQHLNDALSIPLADICIVPTVEVDMNGYFDIDFDKLSPAPRYTQGTSNPVLNFWTVQESKDSAGLGAMYHATVRTETSSEVALSGNTIVVTTIMAMYASIYTLGANTNGYSMATKNVTTFTLSAVGAGGDNAGTLFTTANTVVTDLRQSTNKDGNYYMGDINDPSGWSKFATFGNINDYLDEVQKFSDRMDGYLSDFQDQITTICTNSLGWTFPGGGTYNFYNPKFSTALDLTVETAIQGA